MDSGNGIPEIPPQCVNTREISDEAWMLSQCFKIMMMQAGFAVVESSFVRQKNSANIMMKNTVDLALGAMLYWAFGYALAYGVDPSNPENVNPFCGTGQFFLIDGHDAANWMFQLSFAATAATIDSGAVAERMQFVPYLIYSALMTSTFYPIVTHWCWDSAGWLNQLGFHDFAGSGAVHLMGGASALVAAWYIGPRLGRFADKGELFVTVVQGTGLKKPPNNRETRPYVIVRQLNHGEREQESRSADDGTNPRWKTNLTFDVDLGDTEGDHVSSELLPDCEGEICIGWTTVDDWEAKLLGTKSRHGRGANNKDSSEDSSSVTLSPKFEKWRGIIYSSPMSRNGGRVSPLPGAGPGESRRPVIEFLPRYGYVRRDYLEIRKSADARARERVYYTHFEKVEDFGEANLLIHLTDLRVLEISMRTTAIRDAWLYRLLHAWRPTVSAQELAIIVVDELSDTMVGEGTMTVHAVDKPDPEKFKVKAFVPLSTGGHVEVNAAYRSPQRMTREIFQACDPNKLLFGTFLLWINWYSFNSGSTTAVTGGGVKLASAVAINTTLSACAGGVFSMLWSLLWTNAMMVEPMATGILGGLVGICASCDAVQQWESVLIGTVSAFVSISTVDAVNWMRIDDPCAAIAIHMASGEGWEGLPQQQRGGCLNAFPETLDTIRWLALHPEPSSPLLPAGRSLTPPPRTSGRRRLVGRHRRGAVCTPRDVHGQF